jgi:hypothetical protein
MTVTASPTAGAATTATVRELALVDAKRFARHPLFIIGNLANVALIYGFARDRTAEPLGSAISPAFFLGVFGLIVAHRLTTSLRPSRELVDSLPSSRRRRTAALCLACIVPFLAGIASSVLIIVLVEAYPPEQPDPSLTMAWFGDYPSIDVVAAVLAVAGISALGGPLLGILIAKWAPFRGSALLAVVGIFFLCEAATHWPVPWSVALPWSVLYDEHVTDGIVISSSLWPGVSEVWYAVYALLMCGLAAVAAMLRDPGDRRALLWTGAALAVAAAGAFAMTVR